MTAQVPDELTLYHRTEIRDQTILLLFICAVAVVAFIFLPWTGGVYSNAGDAAEERNSDAPRGVDLLQDSARYSFADSPWVMVAAVGLGIVVVCSVISFIMPRYADLLAYLRFIAAALVIIACFVAGVKQATTEVAENSFVGSFANNNADVVSCIVSTDGSSPFCLPAGQEKVMPSFGLIIVGAAGFLLLFLSKFPAPDAVRASLRDLRSVV